MWRLSGQIWCGLRRAAFGLLAFLPFIGTAAAEPALWVAKSDSATIYLFGTIHVLKPDTDWRGPKIKQAFDSSSTLWLELAEGTQSTLDQKTMWKYGKDPAHPLSTKLSKAEWQKLREAASYTGIPTVAFESMRPWLAALTLIQAPMFKAGYKGEMGVDNQLFDDAKATKKTVMGLETVEQQLRIFADLPPELELELLNQAVDQVDEAAKRVDETARAWLAGEVDDLTNLLKRDEDENGTFMHKILLTDRNTNWADRLAGLAKGGGTHFVAVGAAHLAGSDSVQNLLKQRGFTVERL